MRHALTRFALPALMAVSPALAADPSVPVADAQAVDRAGERGRMIFAYDRAAAIATNDLIAKLPDARTKVGGWIVEGTADSPRVTFYDRSATPRGAYLVTISKGRALGGHSASPGEAQLDAAQLVQVAALRAGRAAFVQSGSPSCGSRPFTSVVLPPRSAGDPLLVYYLTPQTALDTFPIGGHYRIEVNAKGVAGPVRALAGGCATVTTKTAAGARAQAITITDAIAAVPTEIHVLTMYAAGVPVIVGTAPSKRTWLIDEAPGQTRIRVVTAQAK